MEGLPDFFNVAGSLPPELDGALEEARDDDADDLTFGGGFDVPLDGLPAFFTDGAVAGPGGQGTDEMDDLGGITGMSSGGECGERGDGDGTAPFLPT